MRVHQFQTQDSCHSGRMMGLQLLFLPPCETSQFLDQEQIAKATPTMSHARVCYTCLHPPGEWA